MRLIHEDKWWLVLAIYLSSGLALGLLDPVFGGWARLFGWRPGIATALSVNVLLPLAAICLGIACPRLVTAFAGAVAMTLGLVLGLGLSYLKGPNWSTLLSSIPPVLVLACLGYAVVGSTAALVSRTVQK